MEVVHKSDRYYATITTIMVHILLLILFIFFKIVTPLPPYNPEGGGGLGVELNFGDSEEGMGMTNPEELSAPQKPAPSSPQQAAEILRSEDEEDAFVESEKKSAQKREVKELTRPQEYPKITTKEPTPPVNERLYPGKTGGSEGKTGKAGNQGKADGDPYAPIYSGKRGSGGDGGSGGGSGSGKGNGNGTGTGAGTGAGTSFDLGGRGSVSLPKPAYTSEKSGSVVVSITVDRDGNVLSAKAGARGTTVQDSELFRQAESAAKRAKFRKDEDAPEKQFGTITYRFVRN